MWDMSASKRLNSSALFNLSLLLLGNHCLEILSKTIVLSFLDVTCHTVNPYVLKETGIFFFFLIFKFLNFKGEKRPIKDLFHFRKFKM